MALCKRGRPLWERILSSLNENRELVKLLLQSAIFLILSLWL